MKKPLILAFLLALNTGLCPAAVKFFNADLLPGTTNLISVPVGLYGSITIGLYGNATNYFSQTIGITNAPTGTNNQVLGLIYGGSAASVFLWTNTPGTNALYLAPSTNTAVNITNLATAIRTVFPGLNTVPSPTTLQVFSYGTSFNTTNNGSWATNTVTTTNAALALITCNAFGSIGGSQNYPIPGLNQSLALTFAQTNTSTSTNFYGGWQNVNLYLVSPATNGVCPSFGVEIGTK